MTGAGHAPDMACLHSAERNVLISADQILPRISPYIGLHPGEPEADPLGDFLAVQRPLPRPAGGRAGAPVAWRALPRPAPPAGRARRAPRGAAGHPGRGLPRAADRLRGRAACSSRARARRWARSASPSARPWRTSAGWSGRGGWRSCPAREKRCDSGRDDGGGGRGRCRRGRRRRRRHRRGPRLARVRFALRGAGSLGSCRRPGLHGQPRRSARPSTRAPPGCTTPSTTR